MGSDRLDAAGARVIYWRPQSKLYAGTVTGGPCEDPTCTFVHVDADTGGIHHVPLSLLRAAPVPCHRCGRSPSIYRDGAYVTVCCDDCYDGTEDSSTRSEVGASCTGVEAAVVEWNEIMDANAPDQEGL